MRSADEGGGGAARRIDLRRASFLAVLISLAAAVNVLESLLPSPLPWVRLGLANLFTLVALVGRGPKAGFLVALGRVLLGSLLLGGLLSPAFFLSLGGALSAAAVMAALSPWVWRLYSPLALSVAGAFAHGLAQVLILAGLLVRSREVFVLLPWVLFPSLASGVVTGLLANFLLGRRDLRFWLSDGPGRPVPP